MKTNREEILQNALCLFMSVNYEKASLTALAHMIGLTKTGIFNYYPTKQDLFIAVADKYLFNIQSPRQKFSESDGTLADFIEKYVQGVQRAMEMIVELGKPITTPTVSANAGYYHFLQQVYRYYPDAQNKLRIMMENDYSYWRAAVNKAKESGEIRKDIDVEEAIVLFRQVYMGLSFEMSYFEGLDTNSLARHLRYIYTLLK